MIQSIKTRKNMFFYVQAGRGKKQNMSISSCLLHYMTWEHNLHLPKNLIRDHTEARDKQSNRIHNLHSQHDLQKHEPNRATKYTSLSIGFSLSSRDV